MSAIINPRERPNQPSLPNGGANPRTQNPQPKYQTRVWPKDVVRNPYIPDVFQNLVMICNTVDTWDKVQRAAWKMRTPNVFIKYGVGEILAIIILTH